MTGISSMRAAVSMPSMSPSMWMSMSTTSGRCRSMVERAWVPLEAMPSTS